jgi:hypothetical protein
MSVLAGFTIDTQPGTSWDAKERELHLKSGIGYRGGIGT